MHASIPSRVANAPVFLLGAGFSKAVSKKMPLMWEIAQMLEHGSFEPALQLKDFRGDLEAWLSFLATSQPWVGEAENLRQQADFLDASVLIQGLISECEAELLQESIPPWLMRLSHFMSENEASVITFNYDTIVERVALEAGSCRGSNELYAVPLPERRLPGEHGFLSRGTSETKHVTLYKLHGSINWYSRPFQRFTGSEVYIGADSLTWHPISKIESPLLYADLEPVIIPPVSLKSVFYSNETLRAQWARAASSLTQATNLYILGYSFPASDAQTVAMFRRSLDRSVNVTIVNSSSEDADRIEDLFRDDRRNIVKHTGDQAVKNFVASIAPHFVEWMPNLNVETGFYEPKIWLDGELQQISDTHLARSMGDYNTGSAESKLDRYVAAKWHGSTARKKPWSKRGDNGSCSWFD